MSDDNEIIPKPPSHPVATGLLLASIIGVSLNITVIWQELFTTYLHTTKPKKVLKDDKAQKSPLQWAKEQKPVHDYFKKDFGSKTIEDDLALSKEG